MNTWGDTFAYTSTHRYTTYSHTHLIHIYIHTCSHICTCVYIQVYATHTHVYAENKLTWNQRKDSLSCKIEDITTKKDAEKHLERFSSREIFFKCLLCTFTQKTRKMGLGHKRINKMSS